MIRTHLKPGLYRARFRVHEWMPTVWFLTLVPVALLLIMAEYARRGGSMPHAAQRAVVWLILAAFAAAFALQLFALWHSVILRQLAWWGARASGATWRWLTTGWRAPLLLVLGIGWVWRESPRILGNPPTAWAEFFTVNTTGAIVACVVLFVLVYQIFQARQRITILTFNNYAGDDYKSYAEGLSARLLGELQQLSDLYKVIDAANPPAGPGAAGKAVRRLTESLGRDSTTVGVTASVEDIGAALRGAVTTDTKVKLWFFEMPVGAIVATFARFVQGPRLSGSLHRQGSCLILIARLDAKGQSSGWRVEADVPADLAGAMSAALVALTNDLVYRIFTDRVSVGSAKWEAVQHFSDGLRTFRRTLSMQRELTLRLWRAERLFIKALAEDNTFARCYHNLGVVYDQLRRGDLARAAYERALGEAPLLESAYALSQLAWNRGDYATTLHFAQRAIAIHPAHALSWQLAANAQAELQSGGVEIARTETEYWRSLTELREIAAALAWRDLCRGALRGESLDAERRAIEACFGDLSATHIVNGRHRRGRVVLAQALTQTNASEFYFYRGVSWMASEKNLARAAREFRVASLLEDGPKAINYLLRLCRAEAGEYVRRRQPGARERAVEAYRRLMDCPSSLAMELRQELCQACDDIVSGDVARDDQQKIPESKAFRARVRLVHSTVKHIGARPGETSEHRVERLRRFVLHARKRLVDVSLIDDASGWGWAYGMIATQTASELPAGEEKIELLEHASSAFSHYPRELVAQQVLVKLAKALQETDKGRMALTIARQAVWLNPVGPSERRVLGEAYLELQDYARAEREILVSFDLDPAELETATAIVRLHRGIDSGDKASLRQAKLRVLKSLQDIIETQADLEIPELHLVVGRVHFDLMQFDQALAELSIARAQDFQPLECRLMGAACFVEQQAYNEAEGHLEIVIKGLRDQYRSVRNASKVRFRARTRRRASTN
jgi:tetratricopeptide (TPR) repeat protein